jgi:hypothetical protein
MVSVERRGGFTLVEAVISTMLLLLVIAGAYMLVVRSSALVRSGRNHYLAINIAKARIERARNFQYGDLPLLTETNVVVDDNGVPVSSGDFRRTTEVNTNYQPNLTLLTVNVDIRRLKTRQFASEKEWVACLFTEYLNP